MKKLTLALLLALTGCGGGSSPPPPPPVPSTITNVTLTQFDFPIYDKVPTTQCVADPTCVKIGYVTQSVYGKISGVITVSYEIAETGNPVYQYKLNPDNTCDNPASFHVFFQLYGDNGLNEFGRWWSNPIKGVLSAGTQTITVPLTGDQWSSVYGKFGTDAPTQFEIAKGSVGQIGVTFGGGCFFGHGVNISGGTSHFNFRSFEVAQ